jgi:hypothetical protein
MQAGYFPEFPRLLRDLWWGAAEGLRLGWLIIALSFPYNMVGAFIGGIVLHIFPSVIVKTNQNSLMRSQG